MTDTPNAKLDALRERVQDGSYAVDAAKVADAIVARLQAGRSARDAHAS